MSANIVCAVGDAGTVLKTTNGGHVWVSKTMAAARNIRDVYFFDADTGWFLGAIGTSAKSTIGGDLWMHRTSPTEYIPAHMAWVDTRTGCIAGNQGVIFKTVTAGEAERSGAVRIAVIPDRGTFMNAACRGAAPRSGSILRFA